MILLFTGALLFIAIACSSVSCQVVYVLIIINHKIPAHVGVCLITIIIIKNDAGH